MKKIIIALLLIFITASICFAEAGEIQLASDYNALMDTHLSKIFIGGKVMDDVVIGASGFIEFIYLSGEMQESVSNAAFAPQWLNQCCMDIGMGKKGYCNFAVYLVANDPWVVIPKYFTIGGYQLKEEDIITAPSATPFGIDAMLNDYWAFTIQVPEKYCKQGTKIKIGYKDILTDFTVPTIK